MVDLQQRQGSGTDPLQKDMSMGVKPSERRQLTPVIGLREYWYPAMEDRKVKKKPVGLMITGIQLVFFRGKDGQVKALWNVCPHRGGSLMHGDCHFEGTVSCPYHGWTFDGDGDVLAVLPEGPESKIPGKVKARKYPTITLKSMVFVWMGEGEPAPPEDDIPPEMFEEDTVILTGEEWWPVNWRVANENGTDAHAPYVHRDSARALMFPLAQAGPGGRRSEIINGRSTVEKGRMSSPKQFHFPEQGWYWPKHNRRKLWAWLFNPAGRHQTKSPRWECVEEWDTGHHLPGYTRINQRIYMHTRCAVPVNENETRSIFLKAVRPKNWFQRIYVRLHWKFFSHWSQSSNFQNQDMLAMGPQRYDTLEHLSATDQHLVLWRKLVSRARGMEWQKADETLPDTEAEQFARERQDEVNAAIASKSDK